MRRFCLVFFCGVVCFMPSVLFATATLDFEGFPDSTVLTTQYPGVTFSNAIILSAGISLNEFEFPPHSGVNVVSDNGGAMTLTFATPITSFSGFFTYLEPLTLEAFNSSDILVATVKSTFSNNEALSGDPGSTPNEVLTFLFLGGISSITIEGDPAGGSFALDDVTFSTGTVPPPTVPEPSTLLLSASGIVALIKQARSMRKI